MHNTAADPIFVYGNLTAQKLFEYDWYELTALPSRLSAEAYRGMSMTKSGERFWVDSVLVRQLHDDASFHRGQAALIPSTSGA